MWKRKRKKIWTCRAFSAAPASMLTLRQNVKDVVSEICAFSGWSCCNLYHFTNHLSHLVMFCRPAVCERHQEGWVQMPAVAWYLFSLQSLQNQGGTLLLEGKMEEGHPVQYDDYLTFAKCANCFFSGWGKVFHNSQWQGHLLRPLLWGQGIHEESSSYRFDPNWSQVATKCTKCKGVLTTGGVTFRGEPWHRWAFFIFSFFWSPGSGRGEPLLIFSARWGPWQRR